MVSQEGPACGHSTSILEASCWYYPARVASKASSRRQAAVLGAGGGQLPGVTGGVHVKGPVIMMALAHADIGAVYPAGASAAGSKPHARRSPATCWASDSIPDRVSPLRLLGGIARRATRRPRPSRPGRRGHRTIRNEATA